MAEKDRVSLTLRNRSMGILRESQRKIDASKSLHPQFPFHPHEEVQKVPRGEVIKLEIGIWAMGADYEAGESIRLDTLGKYPGSTEVALFYKPRPDYEKNKGTHLDLLPRSLSAVLMCSSTCQRVIAMRSQRVVLL
jgi:hypothetical protein